MRAIVTGSTGQCGPYLCEILLKKNYEVFAGIRRSSSLDIEKIFPKELLKNKKMNFVKMDITDHASMASIVEKIKPTEFYNLAAQSNVAESWVYPIDTAKVNAIGTLICLEAIREHFPKCKFLQFSSSELFGKVQETPQKETTPFYPSSPYAVSKLFAYWSVVNYRESFNLFASNAIFYNMESPRRGKEFVTQKIAYGIAKIKKELEKKQKPSPLLLGNLDVKRDWNDAKNSLEYAWKILQYKKPDDFIIGSGESHSVREFVREALNVAKIPFKEEGDKFFSQNGDLLVSTDPKLFRPVEVLEVCADPSKAIKELGFTIKKDFKSIVKEMVEEALKKEFTD